MTGWLVVNADDLGVSKGATLGVTRAHLEGIVTSASLATTTEFYRHAVDTCVSKCPALGIGLHFTLTSGRPVSRLTEVPGLVDARGFFSWRFTSLLRAVAVEKQKTLMTQIETELEAQLQKLHADGISPDHIDGERHVHLIPGILEIVAAAASRHGIKFVRAGKDDGARSFGAADTLRLAVAGGFAKSWLLSSLSISARRQLPKGVRTPDFVTSYFGTGRTDLLRQSGLTLPPSNTVKEIMVHPGVTAESRGIDLGNTELERYLLLDDRERELEFCVKARDWVDSSRLTNYTRLSATAGMQ